MAPGNKHVVVVGGGPGGACTAMLLSARGFRVTLLEKQARLGGRSGALVEGDYQFDLGSTMLMMRFVAEEMFDLASARLCDEVTLMPLAPMYRLHLPDGQLDVFAEPSAMARELDRFHPGAAQALPRFMRREHERLLHLYPVLQRDWPTLASMVSPLVLQAAPHVGLNRSLYEVASDYFDNESLRLAFSFQSAYLGMSPWECPGGFCMVPYVEHAWGVDHVRGGIHQLSEAMARVARRNGADIRLGQEVARLLVTAGACHGVELTSGERVAADAVVIDADATRALLTMLDEPISRRLSRSHIEHQRESCSTFMLYLGLDTLLPLPHNTFVFARDYQREMERVFRDGTLGEDFSLYVCNPSHTDDTLAPPGHSSLFALVLVPNTRAAIDWSQEADQFERRVMQKLEGIVGAVAPHVQVSRRMTPVDWEHRFNVSHGAVFGPAHSIDQLLAFRLPNRLPHPDNVFLAGGGTNPGSGLPTILESARIAARLLCESHDVPFPAPRPLPVPVV